MCSGLRPLGSVLLVLALLLASEARSTPVLPDEAIPPSPLLGLPTELGRATPLGTSPLQGGATTPADLSLLGTPLTGRRTPASAVRAVPIQVQPLDAPRGAAVAKHARENATVLRTQAGAKPSASGPLAGDEIDIQIDPDLKEAAKTALQWAQEAKQWVRPAGGLGSADGTYQESASADRSAPGRGGAAVGTEGNMSPNSEPDAEYPPAGRQAHSYDRPAGGELNLIREGIKFIKDVAEHPVTWLLMPIVAFGSAAMWVVQYRTQLEKRHVGGQAARGRRGSSDPSRGRLKKRSSRTAGMPTSERGADGTPVRSSVRRSVKPRRMD